MVVDKGYAEVVVDNAVAGVVGVDGMVVVGTADARVDDVVGIVEADMGNKGKVEVVDVDLVDSLFAGDREMVLKVERMQRCTQGLMFVGVGCMDTWEVFGEVVGRVVADMVADRLGWRRRCRGSGSCRKCLREDPALGLDSLTWLLCGELREGGGRGLRG